MEPRIGDSGSIDLDGKQVDCEAIENATVNGIMNNGEVPPKLTPEQERKVYHKVDMRLMPILTLMYLASFLDRGMSRLHRVSSVL